MAEQGLTPTLRERASSTAITVGACVLVGIAATLVLGLLVWFVQIVFGVTVPLEASPGAGPGDVGAGVLRPVNVPTRGGTWFGVGLWLVVVTLVWLASCRIGSGTPGDAVMTLRACTATGESASRGRVMARTAVPVAVYAAAALLGSAAVGLALLALLWAPAFVRADRRTAVDLLVGVVPRSLAPAKIGRRWPAEDATPNP
jgi:hypothetical protein